MWAIPFRELSCMMKAAEVVCCPMLLTGRAQVDPLRVAGLPTVYGVTSYGIVEFSASGNDATESLSQWLKRADASSSLGKAAR